MNHSDPRAGASHGWLHLVVVCGLMLIGIIAVSLAGVGWGGALLGAALIVCLVAMLAVMRGTGDHR